MANTGAIVPDGNYNVEFKIYNASTSSGSSQGSCSGDAHCLWVETRTSTNQVSVVNGYLTANLGSVSALPSIDWSQNLWLTMNIGGTSGSPTWDGEMSPRLQLTAVPYAFNAGQLGGISSSGFIQNTTSVQNANVDVQAATGGSVAATFRANASGSGDILDLQNGAGTNIATFGSTGSILLQNASNSTTALQIRPNGSSTDVLDADTSNSRIGIGNNAPNYTLDVTGDINTSTAFRIGGTSVCDTTGATGCIAKSGSGYYIHNQVAPVQSANFYIQSGGVATDPTAQIQQASGQSGDLLQFRNSSGTLIAKFDSSANLAVPNFVDMAGTGPFLAFGPSAAILNTRASANIGVVLKGTGTQSGDLLQAQDSSGNVLSKIAGSGAITLSPTANSTTALTINGTTGTSAVAAVINQSLTGDAVNINVTNTTGTETNGLLINRNGSGGTTTNGLNITNTLGTTTNGISVTQSGGSLSNGLAFSGTIGTDISRASGTLTLQGGSGITLTAGGTAQNINLTPSTTGSVVVGGTTPMVTAATNTALTIISGSGTGTNAGSLLTLQGGAGGGGAATAGGNVLIQGGTATGTGVSNGGGITLQGGTAAGTGTKGLITLNGGLIYTTVAYSSAVTATITQASVDSYTTILATATATNLVFTVPSPTITTSGRMLNITNAGTNPFTLIAGSLSYILSPSNTAVLVWSGSAWTSAGASSLQAAYGLSTGGSSTTPTIKLINGIGAINIQDADGGLGGGNFLSLTAQSSSGLGAVVFGFGLQGQFFEHPTTDTATAFQIENSTAHSGGGDNTLFAVDTLNGYINIGSTGGSPGGTGSAFNGTITNIETSPNANTTTNIGSLVESGSATANINIGYTNTNGGGSIVNIGSGTSASSGTTIVQSNTTLTLTGGTASTWSTVAGALTLQGAGGININTSNVANTIQIGSTTLSSGTQTINIANNGTAGGVQAVTIGSLLTTSTTLIQGGTGTTAISLAPATNGSITEATTGTGTITLSSAASVVAKSSTNSASAFQVQNTSGTALFNFSTSQGRLNTYGGSLNVNGVANPAAPTLTSSGTGGTLTANTYVYRLDALGTDGSSTTASIPSSPGSVTTSGSASKNTLSWTAVPNAAGYDVYRSIDGGINWFINQVSSATTSIVDNGTTYTWGTSGFISNLSNAGGINLQKGTGVTFDAGASGTYQMEIYDNVNGGNTLTMANYNSGGTIDVQAQNFYLTDTSTFNHDFSMASTGAIVLKNNTNSTAAFQVKNSTPVPIFSVDTSNGRVYIGDSVSPGDSVGYLLVLDNKSNSTADPTGLVGAMYYNSKSQTFRCDEGQRGWQDCLGVPKPNSRRWAYVLWSGPLTVTNTGNGQPTAWPLGLGDDAENSGTSGPSSVAATTSEPAMGDWATTASTNTANSLFGNLNYNSSNNPDFQTYIRLTGTTNERVWAGFTNQADTTMNASGNPAGNYAAFRYDTSASDTSYQCITKDGTTQTITSSGIAPGTTGHKLEVIVALAATKVEFKIDGAVVCDNATHLPAASTLMRYDTTITTLTTAIAHLQFAWTYIESDK